MKTFKELTESIAQYLENPGHYQVAVWRTAFEWRDGIESTAVGDMSARQRDEYNEGMRLIRSHLF